MSAVTRLGHTPVPEHLPDVFAEFCAAGLWPGLGPGWAGRLAAAENVAGPAQVSAQRLELVEGVGNRRAVALAAASAARPMFQSAQAVVACQVLPAGRAGGLARLAPTAPGGWRGPQ